MRKYNFMIVIIVSEIIVVNFMFYYILKNLIKSNSIILVAFTFAFIVTNLLILAYFTLAKIKAYFLDVLVEIEVIKANEAMFEFSDEIEIINHEIFRNLQLIQVYTENNEMDKLGELLAGK